MHIKKLHLIPRHLRDHILGTIRLNEARLSDTFQTMGHYGVLLLAFFFVVLLFMWKEGRLNRSAVTPNDRSFGLPTPYPTTALQEIPRADVGLRMIMDQANGELGTDSARLASPSAPLIDEAGGGAPKSEYPQLDLQGPWSCTTSTGGGPINLYIHNNKVKVIDSSGKATENILFNGDCLYTWKSSTGTKQCGLQQYLDLYTSLLSGSEGIDIGSIIQEQMGSDPARAQSYESLRRSCQKVAVAESVFSIPQNVQWAESSTTDPNSLNLGQ